MAVALMFIPSQQIENAPETRDPLGYLKGSNPDSEMIEYLDANTLMQKERASS